MKYCNRCKKEKPLSEFYKDNTRSSGYHSSCKLCNNANKRNAHARNIKYIRDIKKKSQCAICGENRYWLLCFHHRDPSKKKFTLGTVATRSIISIQKEIDKCDILCYNCHMDLHHGGDI